MLCLLRWGGFGVNKAVDLDARASVVEKQVGGLSRSLGASLCAWTVDSVCCAQATAALCTVDSVRSANQCALVRRVGCGLKTLSLIRQFCSISDSVVPEQIVLRGSRVVLSNRAY